MLAIATWLARVSTCHRTGSMPTTPRTALTRPYLSPNRLPKISATAAGATTKGTSTLIRQSTLPRSSLSSRPATTRASSTWGTEDSRKMLTVLRSATQKYWSPKTFV